MNSHRVMKYIIILLAALVVIVGGIIVAYYAGWFNSDVVTFEAQSQNSLGFTMGGEQYLDRAQNGTKIGEKIEPVTLINSSGQEIRLFTGEKKVLLAYGIAGCSSCKDYYPILLDWAKRYHEQLTVVLVYKGTPKEAEIQEFLGAGIEVILDSNQLRGVVEPGSRFWSLLVTEDGTVEGRFYFETFRWEEFDQLVHRFVTGPWEPMIEPEIQLGQILSIPPVIDYRGETFQLEKYRGKPTLLFILSPACQTCTLMYQFMEQMRETYGERLNQVVVFNYTTEEMWARIGAFHDRYSQKNAATTNEVKTPEELLKDYGLLKFPVFFDAEYRVFNYLKAWITPTMLVLDREGVLVDIYGVGIARSETPEMLDVLMEQILLNLW